jgi:hypothetical protein
MAFNTTSPFKVYLIPGFEYQERRLTDELPVLYFQLFTVAGAAFDLGASAPTVKVTIKDLDRQRTIVSLASATIDTASTGNCHYQMSAAEVAEMQAPARLHMIVRATETVSGDWSENVNDPVIGILPA